jgi:hypothetical protein
MKLSQIAAKPKLIVFSLDDEATVKEYGEPVEFYSWDRQPLDIFMRLANADQQNLVEMITLVKTLILDEEGKEIIKDDNMLPSNLLIKVIAKVVETLGK